MRLLGRINLVLIAAFALIGITLAVVGAALLQAGAQHEVMSDAGLMIDSALAMRLYTATEVMPLLSDQMRTRFLPQSIPYYAATQHFLRLREQHTEYSYKEATLNPTNPRDRASDWEADLIEQFRNHPQSTQMEGERDTPAGRALYLARPIRADSECLGCHGLASVAPATLLARYGGNNGFGWQNGEVIGAQIVSVPFASASANAHRILLELVLSLTAGLLAALAIVNAVLYSMILRPLRHISKLAEQVSLGESAAAPFPHYDRGELAAVTASFQRLRSSFEKALKLIGS
jgi:HAMP domain-containing protein